MVWQDCVEKNYCIFNLNSIVGSDKQKMLIRLILKFPVKEHMLTFRYENENAECFSRFCWWGNDLQAENDR